MPNLTKKLESALLLSIIAAFLGGSVPVFAKIAMVAFPPFTILVIRFFSASLFLLPLLKRTRELNFKTFKLLLPVAFIGALNPMIFFIALQFTKASVSPLIYASVPAMTAIYLSIKKKQQLKPKQIIGIITGLLGVSIIVLLPLFSQGAKLGVLGNTMIFVAAIAFMFYGLISKQKQTQLKITPLALTFYFSLVAGLACLPLAAWELSSFGLLTSPNLNQIFSIFYIGIMGTAIFYLVYQQALKFGSEVSASLFTYLQPVVTIILAIILLGENITLPFIFGGILAVIGAQLASKK